MFINNIPSKEERGVRIANFNSLILFASSEPLTALLTKHRHLDKMGMITLPTSFCKERRDLGELSLLHVHNHFQVKMKI